MSIFVSSQVWKRSRHKGSNLLLLLYIADCANDDDGGGAYPSIDRMAEYVRMTDRNVRYILRDLRDSGELDIQPGTGPRGTNTYRVRLDKMPTNGPEKDWAENFSGVNPTSDMGGSIAYSGGEASFSQTILEPSLEPPLEKKLAKASEKKTMPKQRSIERSLPDDFTLTDNLSEWAVSKGLTKEQVAEEFESFCLHAQSHDRKLYDWAAGFRTWILKGLKRNGALNGEPKEGEILPPLRPGGSRRRMKDGKMQHEMWVEGNGWLWF